MYKIGQNITSVKTVLSCLSMRFGDWEMRSVTGYTKTTWESWHTRILVIFFPMKGHFKNFVNLMILYQLISGEFELQNLIYQSPYDKLDLDIQEKIILL